MPKFLIIHGWSDCSDSFLTMKERLVARQVAPPEDILFVDYESREDDLTFDEVADGLHSRLKQRGLVGPDGEPRDELNIIVHSTGGLVARHWLARNYGNRSDACPVRRIVMLAPANFGSPLAHRGKSFFGSLVKGRWKVGDFLEVGEKLLDGLELASSFQWSLAESDLLMEGSPLCADRMEVTVLVGGSDYGGLRGWINKPGTDGTVVISGTGIGISKLQVDYTRTYSGCPATQIKSSIAPGRYAFGVLPQCDHGSIVSGFDTPDSEVENLMVEALTTPDRRAFDAVRDQTTRLTKSNYSSPEQKAYQQFIFKARDQEGMAVPDYTIEFFMVRKSKWWRNGSLATKVVEDEDQMEREFSRRLNDLLTAEAHTNSKDSSMRRVLVDSLGMDQLYSDVETQWGSDYVLGGRIHIPETRKGIAYDTADLQDVVIYSPHESGFDPEHLFSVNRTFLVDLRVRRYSGYVTLHT